MGVNCLGSLSQLHLIVRIHKGPNATCRQPLLAAGSGIQR